MQQPPKASTSRARPDWEKNYKARQLTSSDWEKQRGTITRLYLDRDLKLMDVRKIMAEEHNFFANTVQYKKKIKKWNLEKNLKKAKVVAMLRIREKRKLAGKLTRFKHKGELVEEGKLERSRKRHGIVNRREVPNTQAATPTDVEYFTPSPGNYMRDSAPGDSRRTDFLIDDDIAHVEPADSSSSKTSPQLEDGDSTEHVKNSSPSLIYMAMTMKQPPSTGSNNINYEPTNSINLVHGTPSLSPPNSENTTRRSVDLKPLEERSNYVATHLLDIIQKKNCRDVTSCKVSQSEAIKNFDKIRSLGGAVWDSWGSGKTILESVLKNDVVTSGKSPFNFDSPSFNSSHHLRHKLELYFCCNTPFSSVLEFLDHLEVKHGKQREGVGAQHYIQDTQEDQEEEKQQQNEEALNEFIFDFNFSGDDEPS